MNYSVVLPFDKRALAGAKIKDKSMKTIRLLTIGNSFADNALTYLEPLAESGGVRFQVGRANLGGCSLEKHWNLANYSAGQPEYPTYTLGRNADGQPRQANLRQALAAEPWDFVTLQQVSAKSWRRDTFEPFLGQLIGLVRQLAPTAEMLLHQTWAYRSDSPFLPDNGLSQALMHARIAANYRHFADRYQLRLLPSGEAVQQARTTPGHSFVWPEEDFDYKFAKAPQLPRQQHSLACGWHWAIREAPEGIPELRLDANHLNGRGCFLAGCVWYATLTGQPATGTTYLPPGLEAKDAAFLRQTADAVV